jgi:general secretion pathway protein D
LKTKTNLLIFIQPHILRDDDQAFEETNAKYNYMRDEQKKQGRENTLLPLAPFQKSEPLPPLPGPRKPATPAPADPVAPAPATPEAATGTGNKP